MSRTDTIQVLTQDELRRLFEAIATRSSKGKRDRAIFVLSYCHGLRVSEVGLLRRVDFDQETQRIAIRRLKDGNGGVYPLDPSTTKALRSYLRVRTDDNPILFPSNRRLPIDRTTLHRLMRRYGELADIPEPKRHFHALRHTCATHLLEATGDIRFVQDWLGQKKIESTQIYAQITHTHRDRKARDALASRSIAKV